MYKAFLLLLLAAGCPAEKPTETDTGPIDEGLPDPVVHYAFDTETPAPTGAIVRMASTPEAMGTGLDALLHDDATIIMHGAHHNGSLSLDGEFDYAVVKNDPRLAPDEFTLSAWVWLASDLPGASCVGWSCSVISKGNTDYDTRGYWLTVDEHHLIRLNIHNGRDETSIYGAYAITPYEWHHLVATFDGDVGRVYVDGELEGFGRAAHGIAYGDEPLLIGAMTNRYGNLDFPGMIDEVKLWDEVLDDEEVAELYEL